LRHLDEYCDARRKAADYYDQALGKNPKITIPFRAPGSKHVFHQYTIQLNGIDRDFVSQKLAEKHIPNMIYYPIPCHKQDMLKNYGFTETPLPVTERLQHTVLSLPIHTELTEEELSYIKNNLLEILN
jgi:dTDP-4-amino-4,6-dideoxygalactose transaminase